MKKADKYAIHVISTDVGYSAVLALVSPYFDHEPEIASDAGAHFEALMKMIEAHESKHHSVRPSDLIEAVFFYMEQQGLKPKDFQRMVGQRSWVYEGAQPQTKTHNGGGLAFARGLRHTDRNLESSK